MIDDETEIAKLFNKYLVNTVKNVRNVYKRTKRRFHK